MIGPMDRTFVAALCLARAGLQVDVEKSYLIESRLAPVARREGYASPEVLIAALRDGADERLGWAVVEAMTASEGEFFRDPEVFARLASEVLPALARGRTGPVKVWNAACGSGQEIYGLAMAIAEAPGLWEAVELYASDLSHRNLEKAQSGVYSQFEVQRGLPARVLVRHFTKHGESFAVSSRVRQMVRWRRANLLDDNARFGPFDLVMFRNRLDQFAPEARQKVLAHLRRALAPGGRLVLGVTEDAGIEFTRLGDGLFGLPGEGARSAA